MRWSPVLVVALFLGAAMVVFPGAQATQQEQPREYRYVGWGGYPANVDSGGGCKTFAFLGEEDTCFGTTEWVPCFSGKTRVTVKDDVTNATVVFDVWRNGNNDDSFSGQHYTTAVETTTLECDTIKVYVRMTGVVRSLAVKGTITISPA